MNKQNIIMELNYVMLEKRYSGNYREFESSARKFFTYGSMAILFTPVFGMVMTYIYRYATDECRKSCGGDIKCYNKCYLMKIEEIIKIIETDITRAEKIEDPKKRESAKKKLKNELKIWIERRNEYEKKVKYAS